MESRNVRASAGSYPAIAPRTSAVSSTLRVNVPTCSTEGTDAPRTVPDVLTSPYVGFNPTTPFNAAGFRIDPPMSVPSAISDEPTATDTPPPALEPPG